MKKILFAFFVLGLGAVIGWRYMAKTAAATTLKTQQAAGKSSAANVTTAVAGPKAIVAGIDVVGTLESPFSVKVASKIAGQIKLLEVREGSKVSVGQVLAKIDDAEVRTQVLQAEANLAEAKNRLAQAELARGSTAQGITTAIEQQQSALNGALADQRLAINNGASQIASAESLVGDAKARLNAAKSNVEGAKADIESARANVGNAKARLTRLETLFKQGYIAQQDVDDARTLLTVQQSAEASLKQKLAAAAAAAVSASEQVNTSQNQLKIVRTSTASVIVDARAKVVTAQSQLKLARTNQSQVPAFEQNLLALKASVNSSSAQLAQIKARLGDTTLTSPIEGTVALRTADPGSYASPGQELLTIQYLKWLYITASVPIEKSDRVKPGVPVTVTLDALPGKSLSATVSEVNPSADPRSRQFVVRARLDNASGELRPGMFARVSIDLERTLAAVAVPREAVKTRNGKTFVVTVDSESTAHQTPVVTGVESATTIEIKKGLDAGTPVVILSYQVPREGQKVKSGREKSKKGAKG